VKQESFFRRFRGAISLRLRKTRPMVTLKRPWPRLSLLLVSLTVVAVMGETVVERLPVGQGYHDMLIKKVFFASTKNSQYWGWSFQPNADVKWKYGAREREPIWINFRTVPIPGFPEYGMRDDGVDEDRVHKVLVLGDSFTFGATVELEEIWCERLEAKYPDVDFVNAAGGGGVAKARAQYEQLGPALAHETVIYQMWLGNEFLDNANPQAYADRKSSENNLAYYYKGNAPIFQGLAERSKLFWMLRQPLWELWRARFPRQSDLRRRAYEAEPKGLWHDRVGNLWLHPKNEMLTLYLGDFTDHERVVTGVRETGKKLHALSRLVRASGRRLIVFLFPFKEQIYHELWRDTAGAPKTEPLKPNRIVLAFCERHEITCVDIYADVYARRDERIYWDYDVHFTPTGQLVASEAIDRHLQRLGVLPGG